MKYSLLRAIALTFVFAACFPQSAWADQETDELRAQIKVLEARLDALEQKQKTAQAQVAAIPAPAATAVAQATPVPATTNNATLAQRVTAIEQQEAQTPAVSVGSRGITVTSPDKQYSMNIHGYIQADDRSFLNGGTAAGTTDTFLIRSARPIIEAKMTDYFDTRFMLDFGRGQSTLLDAYGNFHPVPTSQLVNLRMGEFKVPVGLERWEQEADVLFVERGQTTNLVPYRDIGAMAYGQMIPGQIEYQAGILNGASDLQVNTGDTDSDKDFAGRIFTHPLKWTDESWLQGFGIGVGGTYGNHLGTSTASDLTAGYVTTGQRTYFTYATGDYANGTQWRLNPQAMYYSGPLGVYGEYITNDQAITHGAVNSEIRNNAWLGAASYVLTGENAAFDGVKPAHDFNPPAGEWGAFELVARISRLDVDSKAFQLAFASDATSSRSDLERIIGGTWYFNPAVKLNLDFSYNTFDGGAVGGLDHKPEEAILTRTQFRF